LIARWISLTRSPNSALDSLCIVFYCRQYFIASRGAMPSSIISWRLALVQNSLDPYVESICFGRQNLA
jgi:hypothetical protein